MARQCIAKAKAKCHSRANGGAQAGLPGAAAVALVALEVTRAWGSPYRDTLYSDFSDSDLPDLEAFFNPGAAIQDNIIDEFTQMQLLRLESILIPDDEEHVHEGYGLQWAMDTMGGIIGLMLMFVYGWVSDVEG